MYLVLGHNLARFSKSFWTFKRKEPKTNQAICPITRCVRILEPGLIHPINLQFILLGEEISNFEKVWLKLHYISKQKWYYWCVVHLLHLDVLMNNWQWLTPCEFLLCLINPGLVWGLLKSISWELAQPIHGTKIVKWLGFFNKRF